MIKYVSQNEALSFVSTEKLSFFSSDELHRIVHTPHGPAELYKAQYCVKDHLVSTGTGVNNLVPCFFIGTVFSDTRVHTCDGLGPVSGVCSSSVVTPGPMCVGRKRKRKRRRGRGGRSRPFIPSAGPDPPKSRLAPSLLLAAINIACVIL